MMILANVSLHIRKMYICVHQAILLSKNLFISCLKCNPEILSCANFKTHLHLIHRLSAKMISFLSVCCSFVYSYLFYFFVSDEVGNAGSTAAVSSLHFDLYFYLLVLARLSFVSSNGSLPPFFLTKTSFLFSSY